MFPKIILASQSPRRKQLLEWAEIPFEIIGHDTDERFPSNIPVEVAAIRIAQLKAETVRNVLDPEKADLPILAADTIVVLNEKIIGKPKDREDAIRILTSLSGNKHKVITAVAILYKEKTISFADTTIVMFHHITREQIEYYVDNYNPYDKAGAYAIQEWIGVIGIRAISGDFYNVMGLPVSRVVRELNKLES